MMAYAVTVVHDRLDSMLSSFEAALQPTWWLISERERAYLTGSRPAVGWAATLDGRVFGEQGDLRWRIDDRSAHVVAVVPAHIGWRPDPSCAELALDGGRRESMLLWGRRDHGAWTEGRIPRPLEYEVDAADGDELAIIVQEMRPVDGSSRIHRFLDVINTRSSE